MQNLFLVALCIVAANAFICPDDICLRMTCELLTDCYGRITKGMCGCCDVCVAPLCEGQRCVDYPSMGIPIYAECGFGLVCSRHTGTCIKQLVVHEEETEAALLGTFSPQYLSDGSYCPVQCMGSVCKCVTSDGEEIEGFSGHIGSRMNCDCARDRENYRRAGLYGRLFLCETNGNYIM